VKQQSNQLKTKALLEGIKLCLNVIFENFEMEGDSRLIIDIYWIKLKIVHGFIGEIDLSTISCSQQK
jgi:hypothetical protein